MLNKHPYLLVEFFLDRFPKKFKYFTIKSLNCLFIA